MKVRTIRKHDNSHPPVRTKHPGRLYEMNDIEAGPLIAGGIVEAVTDED